MMNFSLLNHFERTAKARSFLKDFSVTEGRARIISITSFDLWIIDNDMADDPGTDDIRSLAHKGFIQQRSNARGALNRWAKMIKEPESFSVVVNKGSNTEYRIEPWADNSLELAADIGNRVEKFTKRKVASVKAMHQLAVSKHLMDQDTDELIQMISMLEGHSLVMLRDIRGHIAKYNRAVELIENRVSEATLALEDASA